LEDEEAASPDLDEDPDDDLPIGWLRAGSGTTASGGATV
jgi:hypothetical protein